MKTTARNIKLIIVLFIPLITFLGCAGAEDGTVTDGGSGSGDGGSFTVTDTGQTGCYSDTGSMGCPADGSAFYGQDAQYVTAGMAYQDNGDGTVTDLVTGLMWQQSPGAKVNWATANANASTAGRTGEARLGGYTDWRIPTIKELYSLMNFNGSTGFSASSATPYINTGYFDFSYGDESAGERYIDAQYWSSNEYVSTTMGGDATVFGVNFADGRIKGYPRDVRGGGTGGMMFVRYVRGASYGVNSFGDNGDGTVTDGGSGLTWQQADDGVTRNWGDALAYCENLSLGGTADWRLPNAKELQGIVDYTRSPDTTGSAAIDPVFYSTPFVNGAGLTDYGFYWTSTSHLDGPSPGENAVYVSFGEALGWMNGQLLDVHGAGAQRSDPKSGDPGMFPYGRGPQGDVIGIYNFARCVRG